MVKWNALFTFQHYVIHFSDLSQKTGNLEVLEASIWAQGKEDRTRIFTAVASERSRSDEHKLKQSRLPLSTRKHFCTGRVTKHRHKSPRDVVRPPALEIFLANQPRVTFLKQRGKSGHPQRCLLTSAIQWFTETSPTNFLLTCFNTKTTFWKLNNWLHRQLLGKINVISHVQVWWAYSWEEYVVSIIKA